ncbi:MAG: ribose-phosphate diphosphokinase [Sulfolobales archaeon]
MIYSDYAILSLPGDPFEKDVYSMLDLRIVKTSSRIFPDGETYIRLDEKIQEKKIIIVQSMYPEQDRRFVELLEILDVLRDLDKEKILLIPYLAYARQDRVFLEGEPITVRVVLDSLRNYGGSRIYVIEPHSLRFVDGTFVREISGIEIMARKIKDLIRLNTAEKIHVVSPDQGGVERALKFARVVGGNIISFEKHRDRYSGEIKVRSPPNIMNVEGSTVFIVDDILSTGGTIAEVARIISSYDPESIYTVCVHCLFIGKALEKIKSSGVTKIFCGNTVSTRVSSEIVEYIDLSRDVFKIILGDL